MSFSALSSKTSGSIGVGLSAFARLALSGVAGWRGLNSKNGWSGTEGAACLASFAAFGL